MVIFRFYLYVEEGNTWGIFMSCSWCGDKLNLDHSLSLVSMW